MIDVQNDSPSKDQGQQQSTRGTPTTINTMSSFYGPTASDGDKVVDEAWKTHENGHHEDSGDDDDDDDDHIVDHLEESDLEDAELEDKFHCRPRYQHSRIDVSVHLFVLGMHVQCCQSCFI